MSCTQLEMGYPMYCENNMNSASNADLDWQLNQYQQYIAPTPAHAQTQPQNLSHTQTQAMQTPNPVTNNFASDFYTQQRMSFDEASNLLGSSEASFVPTSFSQMFPREPSTDLSDFDFEGNYHTPPTPLSTCDGADISAPIDELMSGYSPETSNTLFQLDCLDFNANPFSQQPRGSIPTSQPLQSMQTMNLSSSAPQVQMPFPQQYQQPNRQQRYSQQYTSHSSPLGLQPVQRLSVGGAAPPPTNVDALMKALDAPTSSHPSTPASASSPMASSPMATTTSSKPKRHHCFFEGCNKAFSQPTHLKIHVRSHTGEKPYLCSIPGCDASFSQLGNLRTHERRHRGEKPRRRARAESECSHPSPGTPASHHDSSKRYECRLDGCRTFSDPSTNSQGKVFTQLGNLKAHMNKFHKETLEKLSELFRLEAAGFIQPYDPTSGLGGNPGAMGLGLTVHEEEELKEYFRSLYKNCNKGIKGRGKGRRVAVVV